jgi:hypothetical protein
MQTDLPLLTEVDEAAIKAFTREFEVGEGQMHNEDM